MQRTAVNWSIIISDLKANYGMSLRDIGASVGLAHVTIRSYYYQLARPKHAEGERIIELWLTITKSTRADIPTEIEPLSAARA